MILLMVEKPITVNFKDRIFMRWVAENTLLVARIYVDEDI